MISRSTRIVNKLGLHARAAARLVAVAGEYGARIEVHCNGQEADAKSIMAIMMLAATCGTDVTIVCHGEDESAALAAITELIDDRFGEDE